MKALYPFISLLMFCVPSNAGILCTGVDHGIEEFSLSYSQVRGCSMTLKQIDGTYFITKVLNPGTANEVNDCKETVVGNDVVTESTVVIDPALVEPGDSYPDFFIKVKGGVQNFEFTFVLVPGQMEWTFTDLKCQQVPDLE